MATISKIEYVEVNAEDIELSRDEREELVNRELESMSDEQLSGLLEGVFQGYRNQSRLLDDVLMALSGTLDEEDEGKVLDMLDIDPTRHGYVPEDDVLDLERQLNKWIREELSDDGVASTSGVSQWEVDRLRIQILAIGSNLCEVFKALRKLGYASGQQKAQPSGHTAM